MIMISELDKCCLLLVGKNDKYVSLINMIKMVLSSNVISRFKIEIKVVLNLVNIVAIKLFYP